MSAAQLSTCNCTTMENTLRSVALLNTKGIHALVMGRKNFCPRALQAFKKALEDLEKVRASDYQGSSNCATCRSCCCAHAQHEENYLEAFNSSPVAQLGAQRETDSFFVYNRAVFFKPLSDTSSIGLTFYAAILQFNMALAHHIRAAALKDAKGISRALKYYKLALKTLRQVGVCGSMADRPPYPGGGESMIYLRLAALNNLAHVHSLGGDFDKVNDTLARVFKFTVAQRPTLFSNNNGEENGASSSNCPMDDCSTQSAIVVGRRATTTMNNAFVNEVLLNVMVSGGPIAAAGAA